MDETSRQRASRAWRERNPERNRELQRAYRLANLDKTRQSVWRSNLKKRFGITEQRYFEILDSQDGCCAICHIHCLNFPYRLSVDHDHATGEIRGLLCRACNLALGGFGDGKIAIIRLKSAIRYLEENG